MSRIDSPCPCCRRRFYTALLFALALGAAACDQKPSSTTGPSAAKLKIAVIPKGTTHDFWQSLKAGAEKAERELGNVDMVFRGPEKEDDRNQQLGLVEDFISSGVSALVLAPLDDKALVAPVRQATTARIPVIIIDSGLSADVGKDFASFVATDNKKGGQLAGQRMIDLLAGSGRVLLLRYQEGSASTMLREEGFVETIKSAAGMTLIDPRRYSGPTRATAQENAENLLLANPDIQGVFCPNESSTYGMLLALRSRQLTGKVRFVGFDSSVGLVDALRAGELHGLIVQNPFKMGYLGVKTAVDVINGRRVEPRIDTGVELVTKENMDQPSMKELISPKS